MSPAARLVIVTSLSLMEPVDVPKSQLTVVVNPEGVASSIVLDPPSDSAVSPLNVLVDGTRVVAESVSSAKSDKPDPVVENGNVCDEMGEGSVILLIMMVACFVFV